MLILSGKVVSSFLLQQLKEKILTFKIVPCFAIIQVGSNPESSLYVNFKRKKAEEIGIKSLFFHFDESVSFQELYSFVQSLNVDKTIHGIIIQLPLSGNLLPIVQYINPDKDIDGLTPLQQGNLLLHNDGLFPCTALGIIELLKFYKITLESKKIAVLGRSNLVGKPLSILLLQENALVTIFHSKIEKSLLISELKGFDIICSAIGVKHFVKPDYIKNNAILVDIGVTKIDKIYGDFHPDCFLKSFAYTPNPGGVGPMTISCLLLNVVKAYINLTSKEI